MLIFPAIDIKDGQCVRLFQGDYDQVTTYGADPVEVALRWQASGASWLHLVDLDGARAGYPVNLDLVRRIRAATSLRIELGGGVRRLEHLEQMLDTGIERVILGTVALTDRELLVRALERWGERVVVGLDARAGLVAVAGWTETSGFRATELARDLSVAGVKRFIYTDIARDGALSGPNLTALQEMQQATTGALIASGGVSSLADLRALNALGIEGAIVGKALYTGAVELGEAIHELERG
ncbi:MAG TPA: 1-(5-phosphoribosyl)-5-[(5-phosphoribosylamino)methylideneamino]imidazole-4-carboxamide isomerase [Ktedonobacteraceae bacterium]|nr:1-(5-phosphoribosyl)-5-[(5-phosphoribosylamino)methylideneamino]imidazole-4-carboxamide isomerase [Ktedonobacteraceae bacterium]